LWNLAACEKGLRHYASAMKLLDRYRDEGRATLSADDRADAAALYGAIEPFTARVRIAVNEPGADVILDGERLGNSPLAAPVVVDLGVRALRVTKTGFRPYVASVPIGGSKEVTIDAKLQRAGGHLKVDAPLQATVLIDGRAVGHGVIDVDLPSGGHTVRVTAPGARVFQSEIVLRDDQARTLTVSLDPDVAQEPRVPEVRVSVGCETADPLAPEQGLRVTFDDDPASQAVSDVRRRWNNDQQADVVDSATYPIDPGHHVVRVRAPDCATGSVGVDVDRAGTQIVRGVLAPRTSFLTRGPAATPDGWRLALGAWAGATSYDDYWRFAETRNVRLLSSPKTSVVFAGPMLTLGLVSPFIALSFDARYGSARTRGTTPGVASGTTEVTSLDGHTTASRGDFTARFGPRLPLYYAAVAGGGGVGLAIENVSSPTYGANLGANVSAFWWIAVDAQPVCDWNVELMVARARVAGLGSATTSDTFALGIGYQPSDRCHRVRVAVPGLKVTR
jgi:hypothetical protein